MIIVFVLLVLLLMFLGAIYSIYYISFFSRKRKRRLEAGAPPDKKYDSYRLRVSHNMNLFADVDLKWVCTTSHDGHRLAGRYYHNRDNAPLVICFHGYRSNAKRDASGGFWYCKDHGYNVLMPDQRAHGRSQSHTITFGIKERYDVLSWIEYCNQNFGSDVPIVLMGVSMGASTVLMASELGLTPNVRGIVADCGYSSPKDILRSVIRAMKLPPKSTYWLARLGARIFGGFDPEGASAASAVAHCKVPLLIVHGDADTLVPCSMAHEIYEAASAEKKLLIVEGAEHGVSFYRDTKAYIDALDEFFDKVL